MIQNQMIVTLLCSLFVCVPHTTCWGQDAEIESATAQKPESLQQRMLGVWVLAGKPGAEIEPKPGARLKFFGLGYWVITQHSANDGRVIYHHGGTYKLDGDRYAETFTFANKNTENLIGTVLNFNVSVKDGKYTQIGDGNQFTEVWVRPHQK